MGDATRQRVALPPLPESVRDARAFVRRALATTGREYLVEDAQLAVSEVVTNAIVHAGTAITVTVSVGATAVRVTVTDGSLRMPRVRSYSDTAATGRGLRLLTELTAEWGVESDDAGKAVWFDLRPPSSAGYEWPPPVVDEHSRPAMTTARAEPGSLVRLLNTPVLLYAAWRQHAEALLREYLLLGLDRGDDEEAVRVHAEASDALALLDDSVPAAPVTSSPVEALAAAAAADAFAPELDMPVPPDVRPHFATLNAALDDAVAMTADEDLLTPAVQPELRMLRRWLCRQVETQCDGAAPQAWEPFDTSALASLTPPARLTASSSRRALRWDTSRVTTSRRALVAADDFSTIIALSRGAIDLLGYDGADQLVGRRLISIIPPRFRQGHLAGVTFHLLTGRRTLLDQPVTVPLLRCDLTETVVQMTVHEEHTDDGRPVFVADLVAEVHEQAG